MNKLIELQKRSRMILPELRKAFNNANQNLGDQNSHNKLVYLQEQWDNINIEIKKEELNFIEKEFGNVVLSEWIEFEELYSSPHTADSEVGQRILFLKGR